MIIDTRFHIFYYMVNSLTFQQENKMSLVRIKSKYQIVIPDDVRKRLNVEIGDTLEIEEKRRRPCCAACCSHRQISDVLLVRRMAEG